MKYSNIIFDFDGVIHDTFEFHLSKINEIYKLGLSKEEYKDAHNGNFYGASSNKLKGIDWSVYASKVKKEQSELVIDPKIKKDLEFLSNKYLLFLVSSGFRVQIEPYLRNNGVAHIFRETLFADDGKSKADKLNRIVNGNKAPRSSYVFITDTLGDILEANKVGLRSIAVTFGFHERERLEKGKPEHIVDTWSELMSILDK